MQDRHESLVVEFVKGPHGLSLPWDVTLNARGRRAGYIRYVAMTTDEDMCVVGCAHEMFSGRHSFPLSIVDVTHQKCGFDH